MIFFFSFSLVDVVNVNFIADKINMMMIMTISIVACHVPNLTSSSSSSSKHQQKFYLDKSCSSQLFLFLLLFDFNEIFSFSFSPVALRCQTLFDILKKPEMLLLSISLLIFIMFLRKVFFKQYQKICLIKRKSKEE